MMPDPIFETKGINLKALKWGKASPRHQNISAAPTKRLRHCE